NCIENSNAGNATTQQQVDTASTNLANCVCPIVTSSNPATSASVNACSSCLNNAASQPSATAGNKEVATLVTNVTAACKSGNTQQAAAIMWKTANPNGLQPSSANGTSSTSPSGAASTSLPAATNSPTPSTPVTASNNGAREVRTASSVLGLFMAVLGAALLL
ncbi:hypothetical protein HK104_004018, partial [Borealophlyctis nickersoniae]